MRRYMVTEGTVAEVHAELDRYGQDRLAVGKHERAHEFAAAMAALQQPGDEYRVEHTLYRIVEG